MSIANANQRLVFEIANETDRQCIYKMRHAVYAHELHQHSENSEEQLRDELDDFNVYITAKSNNTIVGFISITPAGSPRFSIDKYISRNSIPVSFDGRLFEIRLLTVEKKSRYSSLALLLMYAAMRWVEANGGKYIVAICKSDIVDMYRKAGLKMMDCVIKSGAVRYQLSIASIDDLKLVQEEKKELFASLKDKVIWNLPYPYLPTPCFHGGAFFKAIGEDLQSLDKKDLVINADVLDAWFPPSPKVIEAIQQHLSWLLKTSPPTHADGLIDAIAVARGIDRRCIVAGAGSSDLIFMALRYFVSSTSKALIIDPCYGEYIHVLDLVIGCSVTRFQLSRKEGFVINIDSLIEEAKTGYDIIIVVNPNSPTGLYVSEADMHKLLKACANTLVWIDETYIDYCSAANSLEAFACNNKNVIICKSMSKAYALSGVRVAYLCSSITNIQALKTITPPWAVSLPAQVAAINALKDKQYYGEKYEETQLLRQQLVEQLRTIGIEEIIAGVANFILFYLPANIKTSDFIKGCKKQSLFIRDVSNMGTTLGEGAVRIAVKDKDTNLRMIEIIKHVLNEIGIVART